MNNQKIKVTIIPKIKAPIIPKLKVTITPKIKDPIIPKNKQGMIYNLSFLMTYIEDNHVTLIGDYSNVRRECIIKGYCLNYECNKIFEKSYKTLINSGPYCIYCTHQQRQIKHNTIYSLPYLMKYIEDNHVKLIGEYLRVQQKSIIKGYCLNHECNKIFEKRYKTLINSGPYCIYCTHQQRQIKHNILYSLPSLMKYIEDNHVKLIGEYSRVQKESIIKGYCLNHECNKIFEKTYKCLIKHGGPYCNYCTRQQGLQKQYKTNLIKYGEKYAVNAESVKQKTIATNLNKHGVKYTQQAPKIKAKTIATNLERYGVENPFASSEIQTKIKTTNLNKYGVEHPVQLAEIQAKIVATNLERYGYESATQNPTIREKIKATNLVKYGVEYPVQSPEIRAKFTSTMLKKYGVEHALQNKEIKTLVEQTTLAHFGVKNSLESSEIQQKIKINNLEKYGFENSLQSPIIQAKIKATNLEKYGFENALQSPIIQAKIKATNLEKYGFENALQSPIIQAKIKATNLKKYGFENVLQSPIIQVKKEATNLEKYGFKNLFESPEIKAKIKQTNLDKYGAENPLGSLEIQNKFKATNQLRYGVDYPAQNSEIADKTANHAYLWKEYKFPSGKIIRTQGYEHFALNELISKNILEDDIIAQRSMVPKIWWTDVTGKKHRHFVDIFIPSQNRCIEIKSTWTFDKKKDGVFLKQKQANELGYIYEIWIYDKLGNLLNSY